MMRKKGMLLVALAAAVLALAAFPSWWRRTGPACSAPTDLRAGPAGPLAWLGRPRYDSCVTRGEVQQRLSAHPSELKALGVLSLEIFGSVARGDAGPGSDVDLLVEFDRPIGLFLEQLLGCRVDLVMRDAVKPQLRDRIFSEAVRAT